MRKTIRKRRKYKKRQGGGSSSASTGEFRIPLPRRPPRRSPTLSEQKKRQEIIDKLKSAPPEGQFAQRAKAVSGRRRRSSGSYSSDSEDEGYDMGTFIKTLSGSIVDEDDISKLTRKYDRLQDDIDSLMADGFYAHIALTKEGQRIGLEEHIPQEITETLEDRKKNYPNSASIERDFFPISILDNGESMWKEGQKVKYHVGDNFKKTTVVRDNGEEIELKGYGVVDRKNVHVNNTKLIKTFTRKIIGLETIFILNLNKLIASLNTAVLDSISTGTPISYWEKINVDDLEALNKEINEHIYEEPSKPIGRLIYRKLMNKLPNNTRKEMDFKNRISSVDNMIDGIRLSRTISEDQKTTEQSGVTYEELIDQDWLLISTDEAQRSPEGIDVPVQLEGDAARFSDFMDHQKEKKTKKVAARKDSVKNPAVVVKQSTPLFTVEKGMTWPSGWPSPKSPNSPTKKKRKRKTKRKKKRNNKRKPKRKNKTKRKTKRV